MAATSLQIQFFHSRCYCQKEILRWLPLHQVPEQVDDLLLQGGPVLDDGVSFVGHLLLKLLQLLDLLADLQLGLGQGRDPGRRTRSEETGFKPQLGDMQSE